MTTSALIAALVTLFQHFDNKPTTQLQASAEAPRSTKYVDFNMQNSDPNVLIQVFGANGAILLNYRAPLASSVILTVQDGVPYLHYNGNGNQGESNINRWEAQTFGRESEDIGAMPVPSSVRFTARDKATASEASYLIGKKGLNTEEWAPQYMRDTKVNGTKARKLVAAQNVNTLDKAAFWI